MFKKTVVFLLVLLLLGLPTLVSASSINSDGLESNNVSGEEIKEMARELEYIFTVLSEQDENGVFIINEENLEDSDLTDDEKQGIRAWIDSINNENGISAQDNVFKRCWADAVGIGGNVLDEFLGYIANKQWIAAAGVLALAGIVINPITIAGFAFFCGARPVS